MMRDTMKELRDWEREAGKQMGGGVWPPRLTMSLLMEGGASVSNGKTVGVADIFSDVLEALPWRDCAEN